jgi:hypothetical protein
MDGPREVTLKIPELGGEVPRRFRKSVLRVGRFVDPETGEVTNFDRSDLEDLAAATNDWIESGHKVFFPSSGDRRDAYDAKKNMGYWTSFTVEGDDLVAEVDVPDETIATKIGSTIVNVCPYLAYDVRSASGATYDEVIEYVAACTNVVMGGMGGFVALSREGLDRDGFRILYTFRSVKLTAQGEEERDRRATGILLGDAVERDPLKLTAAGEDERERRATEILVGHPVEPGPTGLVFRLKRSEGRK